MGRFDDHRAAKYTYQVANALHYCHLNNVIHRDLKPGKVFVPSENAFVLEIRKIVSSRRLYCL